MALKTTKDLLGSAAGTVNVSTGTNTETEAQKIDARGFCIQAHWAGGSAGTAKLQGTAFEDSYADDDETKRWADIADSSVDMAVSTDGYLWNVYEAYYTHVRLVFTNLTGTYAVRAIYQEKEVF